MRNHTPLRNLLPPTVTSPAVHTRTHTRTHTHTRLARFLALRLVILFLLWAAAAGTRPGSSNPVP